MNLPQFIISIICNNISELRSASVASLKLEISHKQLISVLLGGLRSLSWSRGKRASALHQWSPTVGVLPHSPPLRTAAGNIFGCHSRWWMRSYWYPMDRPRMLLTSYTAQDIPPASNCHPKMSVMPSHALDIGKAKER